MNPLTDNKFSTQQRPYHAHGAFDVQLAEQGHPSQWKNPVASSEYDLLVVGGGPAGLTAALTAASMNSRVALVERHLTGGTCVNYGCTPSKALIACARSMYTAAAAGHFGHQPFGFHRQQIQVDFAQVMERVREMRVNSSSFDAVKVVADAGVDVFLGNAQFLSPESIRVTEDSDPHSAAASTPQVIRFRKAVIAVGAHPRLPAIEGLADVGFLTNESVFGLTKLPRRLVVLGAGPVGCELAQAFRQLGSEVDLVTEGDRLLPREVPEAAEILRRRFSEQHGMHIHFRATLRKVELVGSGMKRLVLSNGTTLECDQLLVCVGRVPNLEGLGLELANVEVDARGSIKVGESLRSSNPLVYAAGDCCDSPFKFTHAAMAMGRVAVQNALLLNSPCKSVSSIVIPWCTFTDPEVAQVGLTPHDAKRHGVEVDIHRLDLKMIERAVIEAQAEGFAAIYTRKNTSVIVGATLVSAHAGESIPLLAAFIQHALPMEALAATVHCYPTQVEVFKRIAESYVLQQCKKAKKIM